MKAHSKTCMERYVRLSGFIASQQQGTSLVFNETRLRRLCCELNLRAFEVSLNKAWVPHPKPPAGLSCLDVGILLLSSEGYCITPHTFPWELATDVTYQALWKLMLRITTSDADCAFIAASLLGRSLQGYRFSRSLPADLGDSRAVTLGEDFHLMQTLTKLVEEDKCRLLVGPHSVDSVAEVTLECVTGRPLSE